VGRPPPASERRGRAACSRTERSGTPPWTARSARVKWKGVRCATVRATSRSASAARASGRLRVEAESRSATCRPTIFSCSAPARYASTVPTASAATPRRKSRNRAIPPPFGDPDRRGLYRRGRQRVNFAPASRRPSTALGRRGSGQQATHLVGEPVELAEPDAPGDAPPHVQDEDLRIGLAAERAT